MVVLEWEFEQEMYQSSRKRKDSKKCRVCKLVINLDLCKLEENYTLESRKFPIGCNIASIVCYYFSVCCIVFRAGYFFIYSVVS